MNESRSGARILVDQLLLQGVNHLFCVPGESFLGVLDALHDNPGLRLVVNRHESASTFMATGYARLVGQPGVAFVTRGPGACNASIGIHTAFQDSLPVVLFVGQTPTEFEDRESFQEIDCERVFGSMTKWVAQIDRADRIPEYVARAFQTAASGRPGPVVLGLPEDVLDEVAGVEDARCHQAVQAAPSDTQIASLRRMLGRAQRPIVIVGGPGWNAGASANLMQFAEVNRLPVACAFRYQDAVDNRHLNYAGDVGLAINPQLAARIERADLVIALGARLGEATTGGYTLLRAPVPQQTLIHAHASPEELGRVYQADLMINTGMAQIAARLAMMTPIENPVWEPLCAQARAEYESWQERPANGSGGAAPECDLWQIIRELRAALPSDAIVANGAGNFAGWLHRFFPFRGQGTQLAPTGGSMGYGVPAAIAAKIVAPEKVVVCASGDGDFLMTAQELATAAQYNAGVVFLVFDNGMYGTIRMHQEKRFPGRVVGTALTNPDFVQFAKSFGASAVAVSQTAEFEPALAEAMATARSKRMPAVVVIKCDPRQLSPTMRVEGSPGAKRQ